MKEEKMGRGVLNIMFPLTFYACVCRMAVIWWSLLYLSTCHVLVASFGNYILVSPSDSLHFSKVRCPERVYKPLTQTATNSWISLECFEFLPQCPASRA
jgi:hypothetical protein